MEREFYVHLTSLDIPEPVIQYYLDNIYDFTLNDLGAMLHWTGEDFITHYELQEKIGSVDDPTFLKALKKVVEYLLDSEERHYAECLGDGNAENHIYLSAYTLHEWLRAKEKTQ